jgi:hypothetical protein
MTEACTASPARPDIFQTNKDENDKIVIAKAKPEAIRACAGRWIALSLHSSQR